jgi:hypothetical protein
MAISPPPPPPAADIRTTSTKYALERNKRLKDGGNGSAQYLDLRKSDQHAALLEDPWIPAGEPINEVVAEGGHVKVVILGAGFGGILFAVRLIKEGWRKEDLVIVDSAGGFGMFFFFPGGGVVGGDCANKVVVGGTWYWNRKFYL